MLPTQFEMFFNVLETAKKVKVLNIIIKNKLMLVCEESPKEAFIQLSPHFQREIESVIIPDEINFNRFGMEQTTKNFHKGTKVYELLDEMEIKFWEIYIDIIEGRGVTVKYDNAKDKYTVHC